MVKLLQAQKGPPLPPQWYGEFSDRITKLVALSVIRENQQ